MKQLLAKFTNVLIIAASLLVLCLLFFSGASAGREDQGKGGEIKRVPTPTPAPKKTTTTRRSSPARSANRSRSNRAAKPAKPTAEIDRKLAELKKKRNALLGHYTAESPEVKKLDQQIELLEKQREDLLGKTTRPKPEFISATPPKLLKIVSLPLPPEDSRYPFGNRMTRVYFNIDESGKIVDRNIVSGSNGHPLLVDPTFAAANQEQGFAPAVADGVPVKSVSLVFYLFTSPFSFSTVRITEHSTDLPVTKEARSYLETAGDLGLEMIEVPAGTFRMGTAGADVESIVASSRFLTTEDDRARERFQVKMETPQHAVTVAKFYISKYPVTQAQWRLVATRLPKVARDLVNDPSTFKGDDRPVEQVSYLDVVEFCYRLSRATGLPYRLPTEAEWEYACRAGTTTEYAFGDAISTELANVIKPGEIARGQTTPVRFFKFANAFGLYDMHGNVWEWCLDYWRDNYSGAPTDGSAWMNAVDPSYHVVRGGSWRLLANYARSARRHQVASQGGAGVGRNDDIGFRVVIGSP